MFEGSCKTSLIIILRTYEDEKLSRQKHRMTHTSQRAVKVTHTRVLRERAECSSVNM